jgi:hypothetical protein
MTLFLCLAASWIETGIDASVPHCSFGMLVYFLHFHPHYIIISYQYFVQRENIEVMKRTAISVSARQQLNSKDTASNPT